MSASRSFLRRVKLRYLLFLALFLSGLVPLALSSGVLVQQSEEVLQNAERDYLIHKAGALSREVNESLVGPRRQLQQLGAALLAAPGPEAVGERLRAPWVGPLLDRTFRENPDLRALRVLDPEGKGPEGEGPQITRGLDPAARAALLSAFEEARGAAGKPAYRFVGAGASRGPLAALAVPVSDAASGSRLIVEAVLNFRPVEKAVQGENREVNVFLVDRAGRPLWSSGEPATHLAGVLRQFALRPMSMIREIAYDVDGERREVLVQISAVEESGWGVVVQRSLASAFARVNRLVFNALLSTVLLVAFAFLVAYLAAGRISQPIRNLADTTHEIAAGNFGHRIETGGPGMELANLAENFNRMSSTVESHIQQLHQAAQANRELFIGSLRAFVAAVDAKDPYTRGHSERVAAVSRTISRQLALPEEFQHRVWIGALLHDVGKIGVEDHILRKSGVLTPEEYEQMKLHTVMGADILSRIEQLKEMVPAVRWHHESWNGRGYPDGLKGEQIPLIARIVAVADCFDAITTTRPYQQAYSLQFAVETITKLTGSRFDAKVVTAFLRAFEAGEVRRPREAVPPPVEVRAAVGAS